MSVTPTAMAPRTLASSKSPTTTTTFPTSTPACHPSDSALDTSTAPASRTAQPLESTPAWAPRSSSSRAASPTSPLPSRPTWTATSRAMLFQRITSLRTARLTSPKKALSRHHTTTCKLSISCKLDYTADMTISLDEASCICDYVKANAGTGIVA